MGNATEVMTLASERVESQTGPGPLDRCAECGHPMRRATDRVDYGFFTLDPGKQTILAHFGGVVRRKRKFRFPGDLGQFFHSSCAPTPEVKLDLTNADYDAVPKEIREQFEAAVEALRNYMEKQPEKYAIPQREERRQRK